MKAAFILSAVGFAASAVSQAVSVGIAPSATAPAGCEPSYAGNFTLNVLDISFSKKAAGSQLLSSSVTVNLTDGVMYDSLGRVGAIVSNHQFQFDGPPQAGSIYTGGWSACSNSSLALGGSTIFYACTSGSFRNLYDEYVGAQCSPINIIIVPVGSPSTTTGSVMSSTATDMSTGTVSTASGATFSSVEPTTLAIALTSNSTLSATLSSAKATGSTLTTGSASGSVKTGATTAASSTASTGAAAATLAAARDILGAAVGAVGAAIILF